MKRATILAVLASCATPYQEMGFTGGYETRNLGGGVVSVHVRVNGYSTDGAALEYAYRRAGEVCPAGYDVVNAEAARDRADKPEFTLLVRCRGGR